jgi:hypothetical protein
VSVVDTQVIATAGGINSLSFPWELVIITNTEYGAGVHRVLQLCASGKHIIGNTSHELENQMRTTVNSVICSCTGKQRL